MTKKLASFMTSLTLSTMVNTKLTMVMYNLKAAVKIEQAMIHLFFKYNKIYYIIFLMFYVKRVLHVVVL